MRLGDYLEIQGETQSAFARRSGVPQSTVSEIVNELAEPKARTIDKIERATAGLVRAQDLYLTVEAVRRRPQRPRRAPPVPRGTGRARVRRRVGT